MHQEILKDKKLEFNRKKKRILEEEVKIIAMQSKFVTSIVREVGNRIISANNKKIIHPRIRPNTTMPFGYPKIVILYIINIHG